MAAIYCGSRFCRYGEDGTVEVIRVCGDAIKAVGRSEAGSEADGSQKVAVLDAAGKRRYMALSELAEYSLLMPDGVMMFNIVSMNKEIKDVVVTLSRMDALQELPYAVCRQYIYDYFSNKTYFSNKNCFSNKTLDKEADKDSGSAEAGDFYMGMSVSRDTVDAGIEEIPLAQTLMCGGIKSSFAVAVYLEDSLDGILRLFSNRKYNNVLAALKESQEALFASRGRTVRGYNATLAELLADKRFMADFRRCFRVAVLPGVIGEAAKTLSAENIEYLRQGLQAEVTDVRVRRYSRDIDLGAIEDSCILAASAAENLDNVYVVEYRKSF